MSALSVLLDPNLVEFLLALGLVAILEAAFRAFAIYATTPKK